jgi:hypothetical protein
MKMPDGTKVPVTESISWVDMDQEAFQGYWGECIPIIEELMGMSIDSITKGIGGET